MLYSLAPFRRSLCQFGLFEFINISVYNNFYLWSLCVCVCYCILQLLPCMVSSIHWRSLTVHHLLLATHLPKGKTFSLMISFRQSLIYLYISFFFFSFFCHRKIFFQSLHWATTKPLPKNQRTNEFMNNQKLMHRNMMQNVKKK